MFCYLTTLRAKEPISLIHLGLFATSHQKGVVDGIGGTIKRKVFMAVKSRERVIRTSFEDFKLVKEKMNTIEVLWVPVITIKERQTALDTLWKDAKPCPGTHSLYHVKVIGYGKIETSMTSQDPKLQHW